MHNVTWWVSKSERIFAFMSLNLYQYHLNIVLIQWGQGKYKGLVWYIEVLNCNNNKSQTSFPPDIVIVYIQVLSNNVETNPIWTLSKICNLHIQIGLHGVNFKLTKLHLVSYLLCFESDFCSHVLGVSNVHFYLFDNCGSSTNIALNPRNFAYGVQVRHMVHLYPPLFWLLTRHI